MRALKALLAAVVGMVAGGSTVGFIEWLSSLMHPMPAGLSVEDADRMAAWVSTLPALAFLMLAIAWGTGCLVGAMVARWLSPARTALPAVVVVCVLTMATISMLVTLPHPWWLWPLGILSCLVMGALGIALSSPREYTIATTRSIDASVVRVFQTLASVENFSKAVEGITNIEFLTEQKYGVGTRFRETRLMHGKEASTELEVTELVENQHVRIVSDAGGTVWDTVFTVGREPSSEVTQMTMRMDVRPYRTISKLITPMILKMVQTAVISDMDAVKQFCESEESDKVFR